MIAATEQATAGEFEIDLDQALAITLPTLQRPLFPVPFTTPDGLGGWVLGFEERRPIATPAYANGKLFVGAGYGSFRFCAFDALTGQLVWQIETADDGPSAAVAEDGVVAFSTESCTVIVCEADTGRVVWAEWLGDPLMSQPAIAMGKLFIAYPAHQRKPRFVSSMTVAEKREAIDDAKKFLRPERFRHQMLCADLMTGEHLWERDITADVITAPVVHGDQLFFTCMDGTSFCLDASDGRVVWQKQDAGTSAPLVWGRHVFKMHKDSQDQSIEEALKRTPRGSGEGLEESPMFSRLSPYRHTAYGGGSGVKHSHAAHLDAGVGFAVGPAAAKLDVASAHLGVSTVSGAWAYQGSRPARGKHGICNAQGNTVYCVTEDDASATKWRAEVKGATVNPDDQIFLPPALGRESIYLTSMLGHIVSLHQETGAVGILYSTDRPISFQPTLAAGSVFVGTSDGLLLCINTGSPDADGWYMWGGNAQHNLTCEAE